MSKTCVTHHFACDCREAALSETKREIEALKLQLAEKDAELRDVRKFTDDCYRTNMAEITKVKSQLAEYQECVAFYADPENWRGSNDRYYCESHRIDDDDGSDYPHITREVRSCGGKRARALKEKWEK